MPELSSSGATSSRTRSARPLAREPATLVDILVVNAVEAETLSGVVVDALDSALRAAAALLPPGGTGLVTASSAGVAAAAPDREVALPAIPVDVASTHGAGDTFCRRPCSGDWG
jgi:ribokinase